MTIEDIATEIFAELDEPDDATISSISYWLISNVGQLNNFLGLKLTIIGGEYSEDIEDDEKVIVKKLYESYYVKRQVNKNLGAAAYSSIAEIKEGGRTVRKTNKNEVAKSYLSSLKDINDDLNSLISNYKVNRATPSQVSVPNPILTEDISHRNIGYRYVGFTRGDT